MSLTYFKIAWICAVVAAWVAHWAALGEVARDPAVAISTGILVFLALQGVLGGKS